LAQICLPGERLLINITRASAASGLARFKYSGGGIDICPFLLELTYVNDKRFKYKNMILIIIGMIIVII